MSSSTHDYPLIIREHHLDTFGHVNNATYLELLEDARWEWITSGGYGLDTVAKTKQGPTILECTVKFRRELRNRQAIIIRSWGESYVGKIAQVRQDIVLATGELACSAHFVMGLFDLNRRQLIDPTPQWLACVGWTLDDWTPKA